MLEISNVVLMNIYNASVVLNEKMRQNRIAKRRESNRFNMIIRRR